MGDNKIERVFPRFLELRNDKIEYSVFGEKHKPTESHRIERAVNYAFSYYCLNSVGCGSDENLSQIRQTMASVQELCLTETGFLITDDNLTFKELFKFKPFGKCGLKLGFAKKEGVYGHKQTN